MSQVPCIDGTTSSQLETITQMLGQGFQLKDKGMDFDPSMGVIPVMVRGDETICILVCGETCLQEEWEDANCGKEPACTDEND